MATYPYITIFLLVFCAGLFSQPPDLQFDHITSEDGLSNNSVYCILQDSRGFMWFGTYDGLNRYDGYTFKIFKNDPADSTSLSNNTVWSILEDSSECIWVGTNEGLNKYNRDTEKFTRYLNDTTNSRSISNDISNIIYEDKNGTIWIGTENGLNCYNRTTDDFTRFFFEGFVDSTRFYWNNNRITVLAEDHNGQLLIGTMDDFIRFNPETGENSIIPDYAPYHPEGNWWPVMSDIYQDRTGLYWIGLLLDGVATFDSRTGSARLYAHDTNDPYSFSADFSHSIYEDQSGLIWIASNDGLNIFDRKTEKFSVLRQSSSNKYSLSSNEICVVFGDRQGNIWIGTKDMGINKLSRWKKPFKHYIHNSEDPSSLPSGEVHAICEDRTGKIWTGSYGGGLSCLNTATGKFTNYRLRLGLNFSDFSMVFDVHEDRFGNIWSCYLGINRLDPRTGTMKYFWHEYSNTESHADTWTYCVYEDIQGILWFGTFGSGLERFNREKETFTHFKNEEDNPQSLASNDVYTIYQDTYDYLWIGTGNGLCKMMQSDEDNIHFIRYQNDPKIPNSITGSTVYAIFEDKKNRFWIGTNGGLNRMDREKETFSVLTETDGLPCNDIYSVLEDDHGFLWLRTKRGLVKYHPETQFIRTYDERDGLTFCKSIVDGFHAFCRGKKGEIYYGGANSIAVFHPDSLRDNPDPPILVLTDFRIHNQPIEINAKSPLQKSITETEVIKLSYNQNMISFDFAAIDYTSPDRNQHAYQMEGVDQNWIHSGNQHTATYTNLDPGDYVFRVKGANNDGIWNEEGTAVKIIITPPLWRTDWAYAGYLLLVIGAVAATWRLQMRRIRVRNELKMRKFEAQKLQEVDHLKSRFFANISHEFRTPLTLILGPINMLLAKFSDKDLLQELTIMQRNAKRLHRLINQLLELSKIEAGNMKLQAQPTNIVALLNRIIQSFESQAKLKNIELLFQSEPQKIMGYIDREKLETIINNLLSNAFKFTPEGGKVAIRVKSNPLQSPLSKGEHRGVEIILSDTGIGIPPDRLPRIFDRFYRVEDSYGREPAPLDSSTLKKYQLGKEHYSTGQEGTGIGLALTKELVELHHGKIEVISELGKGTTFTIYLPLGKEHLKPEEIVEEMETRGRKMETGVNRLETGKEVLPLIGSTEDARYTSQDLEVQTETSDRSPVSRLTSPLLLIVEDNPDMRNYLCDCLQAKYRLLEAADGEAGLHKAVEKIPDLIISDVMMPKMDGFELCTRVKTDLRTSHIPVILLTARADSSDKIDGLETGADDYLTKPFDTKELQVRVKNLIEQRRRLREKFNRDIFLQPKEFACSSYDERFLQRVMEIIEQYLEDPDFKIVTLTKEIGMSRKQLYRKIHALTNQSANRFIRSLRLKRAADLLQKKYGNVAEVSYKVGFNNPSYFAECFRKQFGTLPSEYGKF